MNTIQGKRYTFKFETSAPLTNVNPEAITRDAVVSGVLLKDPILEGYYYGGTGQYYFPNYNGDNSTIMIEADSLEEAITEWNSQCRLHLSNQEL
jgi:hypothetical protein